jgi:hypothetical protein
MSSLIVIRIVPQKPTDPLSFSKSLAASGGLQITVATLVFASVGSQPPGANSVTVANVSVAPPAPGAWTVSDGTLSDKGTVISLVGPAYPAGLTGGIVQQVNFVPSTGIGKPNLFELQSVATALIEVPWAAPQLENISVTAVRGNETIQFETDYYVLAPNTAGIPDLTAWAPGGAETDPWAQQPANLYLTLPPAPPGNPAAAFQMPSDGNPPPFGTLLTAVNAVLAMDPGPTAVTAAVVAPGAQAGATQLPFGAGPAGVVPGMAASGAGIAAGATVVAIAGGVVSLSEETTADIAVGENITFTPAIGGLTLPQCRNIAYELLWLQQPALPVPPDPIENLYTNPPNNGSLLSGGNSANQNEGDRQQFEAQLKTYYAGPNATADRLANYVYSVSAAVACEQMSLAAPQAVISFPPQPTQSGGTSDQTVILTALDTLAPPAHFGVPAAFFYAIAGATPASRDAKARYTAAVGDQLPQVLSELTAAISAQTISDSEGFSTPGVGGTVTAAQAARRIGALGVPRTSSNALAPLNTISRPTTAPTVSGKTLTVTSVAGLSAGMSVNGPGTAPGTTAATLDAAANTVGLSTAVLFNVPNGVTIVFTPTYSAEMQALVNEWLAFPAPSAGQVSSAFYEPGDDDALFWPDKAAAHPAAFLELALCALTGGYIIPPPFSVALGSKILDFLKIINPAPTVETLAQVTQEQWTALLKPNPIWLPPQPGGANAQLGAFIEAVRNMFAVGAGGPISVINIATSAPAAAGDTLLAFPATAGIQPGWRVTSLLTTGANQPVIPPSARVAPGGVAATTVTLTQALAGPVPAGTNITFRPAMGGTAATGLPVFSFPSKDWIGACLTAYDATYTFGSGIADSNKLATAANGVLTDDPEAQEWLVAAITTIDALCAVVAAAGIPVTGAAGPAPLPGAIGFSTVEALYACGFQSAADISALSQEDFAQAVAGSPAFDEANAIHTAAVGISPPQPAPTPDEPGFHPVNEDGSLTNCIPPPSLSPLGPVAYLHELLGLAENATSEQPEPATPGTTLGQAVSARRGQLGDLLASKANLDTPVPLIDLVNECLEFIAAAAAPVGGVIYDTPADEVAGLKLCQDRNCGDGSREDGKEAHDGEACHEPAWVFAAVPCHSTPADPGVANAAVQPAAYDKLKTSFFAPGLPYDQPLDVNRTILRHLGSCRFEAMRTFRRCITEFVLNPSQDPAGFDDQVWRYPVRLDIAMEYLGITAEEYGTIFQGRPVAPCVQADPLPERGDGQDGPPVIEPRVLSHSDFRLLASEGAERPGRAIPLPPVLETLGLSYCEFVELWRSGMVPFGSVQIGARGEPVGNPGDFPPCEPCCLDAIDLTFPRGDDAREAALKIIVFARLWRKLRAPGCCGYNFGQLADICEVLQLFTGADVNPEFVRQLAAFQMLRDDFHLPLDDGRPNPGATGVARTPLLALWATPASPHFPWAVRKLVEGVARHALKRHVCARRDPEFLHRMASELDALSRLAGFDPASATDNWHALPTHTLRFAEILAKLYASTFRLTELRYLFTVDPLPPDGRSPFPLQEPHEALVRPLGLPDDQHEFSLRRLRHKLLEACIDEEEVRCRDWRRVAFELRTTFGFAEADVLALGEHFFPHVLECAGCHVVPAARRFSSPLAAGDTSPATWDTPPDGPFQYDQGAAALWTKIPLEDEAVLRKLGSGHDFSAPERTAIQDLYFQPRAMLARFALLFPNFAEAVRVMVEGCAEEERWEFFRCCVALCHRRRRIIAKHLACHVAEATCEREPPGEHAALLLLNTLYADENALAPTPANPAPVWENPDGTHAAPYWPQPNGSALAALLALTGTGLVAEYAVAGGGTVWRDASGSSFPFGRVRDRANCPVPTVLPAMDATVAGGAAAFVTAHNGLLFANGSNRPLGGAQGFTVTWTGALLVDHEGEYEFRAGAPRACGEHPGHGGPHDREHGDREDRLEKPDWDGEPGASWSITLKRGSRTWVLSSRGWTGQEDRRAACLHLHSGSYQITVALTQPGPDFASAAAVRPRRTGLELHYKGEDTGCDWAGVPHSRLYQVLKDKPLGDGLTGLSPGAAGYLGALYVGSLRDIRRTYQRAFKALLFAHRFGLHAAERPDEASELGYFLGNASKFAGTGFLRAGASFTAEKAEFDLDYLPVADDFNAPAGDQRANPSPPRIQAMFDWWERVFDYTVLRAGSRRRCDRHAWRMFEEASEENPADPGYLLREIGAPPAHWPLDLHFYQAHVAAPYAVTAADLTDERWAIRAWRADRWLDALQRHFAVRDLGAARPDLWADDNPASVAGQVTGNGNLFAFLCANAFDPGAPRRCESVRQLVDGLRRRARDALAAYLCGTATPLPWGTGLVASSALDLSGLLLMDVETGADVRMSRIEEAINAVCTFVRQARLGRETVWTVTPGFAQLWDERFASYGVWRACKARTIYKENWIEWTERGRARRSASFRFLEERLEAGALTLAMPGGAAWWPHPPLPVHGCLPLAERAEPVEVAVLPQPREGLGLLASPERATRPAWVALLPQPPAPQQGPQPEPQPELAAAAPASAPAIPEAIAPPWMRAAIGMGAQFVRVPAAGIPVAANRFRPHPSNDGCVECCTCCGREHGQGVDEYWFWLVPGRYFDNAPLPSGIQPSESDLGYEFGFQDDFYDGDQQQSAFWQDPTQLPHLLAWEPLPMVRLAWARTHNGEFLQPQRSTFYVPVAVGGTADLAFAGRSGDSLYFTVAHGTAPEGYADPSPPGFRFDLAANAAVALPGVAEPDPVPSNIGGLPAYPWFAYAAPGTPPFPVSPFMPSLTVARWLRAHCRYEAALHWARQAFDPMTSDCTWVRCGASLPVPLPEAREALDEREPPDGPPNPYAACCDSADVSCAKAEERAVLLFYLETLADWGHATMCRRRSPEAFQQARAVFDAARILLGTRPVSVRMPEPETAATVDAFMPAAAPLNPRLLDIYDRVGDQLSLIRNAMDAARLPDASARGEGPYSGESPLRDGWRTAGDPCLEEAFWCVPESPYRFSYLIQKALDYCGKAQELGNLLLSAFEKGDAEYLAAIRAGHERELLELGLDGKKDQWREADWQVESLQKTKAVNQANLTYTNALVKVNLVDGELQYQDYVNSALSLRSVSMVIEGVGEVLRLIPDFVVGGAGFGGSPVAISWLPLGTKLGDMFAAIARIMNNGAQIDSETAGLDLTQAGWARRYTEWVHQQQVLAIEIQQVERQILGAQRRRDQMLHDINVHRRQMEHAAEVDAFLHGKFTNHDLYLFLQRELGALYYQTYELALGAARQAERAFNLERGYLARRFIDVGGWDDLREGLTAAERLASTVRRMEKVYTDENVREYEKTEHIPLRSAFPFAFLQLRTTGRCEFSIPEWMFDLHNPGQYMRRIRSVSLTLPCVAGPYTGVHARLTLVDSTTRIDPRLQPPEHACCCPEPPCSCGGRCEPGGYRLRADDPRMVRIWGEREVISTSTGNRDSGLFELSFNDPRYLPFEYMGAVGGWRLELPPENNYFDPDTLTELVMHLNYTSREGGDGLREAARRASRCRLPGDGWAFFDARHDFADAWELMHRPRRGDDGCGDHVLAVGLRRRSFPFLPHNPPVRVARLVFCIQLREYDRGCPEYLGCPCPEEAILAHHTVTVAVPGEDGCRPREERLCCFADSAAQGLYIGGLDIETKPFRDGADTCRLEFRIPEGIGAIEQVYLLCNYEVVEPCCCNPPGEEHLGRRTAGERDRQRNGGSGSHSQIGHRIGVSFESLFVDVRR